MTHELRIDDLAAPVLNDIQRMGLQYGESKHTILTVDAVCEAAVGRTGLDDFGPDGFRERLQLQLSEMDADQERTGLGRMLMFNDCVRNATSRLLIRALLTRHPEILDIPIEKPLIVVGLPRSAFGTAAAHFGLGLTVLGIVATSSWQQEVITTLKPGESVPLAGFTLTYRDLSTAAGPNYEEKVAAFTASSGGTSRELRPAKRRYPSRAMDTTESAIFTYFFSDLYLSVGDIADDKSITLHAYWKPLVVLIWGGAMVMALGGLLSLSDRRLRVGVPKAAPRRAAVAAE